MINISLSGNGFYPSKLDLGISLDISAETGVLQDKGRYKGEPSPYGLCYIREEGKDYEMNDIALKYCKILLNKKDLLKDVKINFNIILNQKKENSVDLFFESELLLFLYKLKATLEINVIDRYETGKYSLES